jgi:hypothetical protein
MCFRLINNDLILNLGGNTITGDGDTGDEGVDFVNYPNNVLIKNGTINNFGTGVSYDPLSGNSNPVNCQLENITFTGSTFRDITFNGWDKTYSKSIEFTDCSFSDAVSITGTKDVIFNDESVSVGNAVFNNIGNLDLTNVNNFTTANEFDLSSSTVNVGSDTDVYITDFPNSRIYYNTISGGQLEVVLAGSLSTNTDGFQLQQSDLIVNLDGNTITNTDGNDYGIEIGAQYAISNSEIKNGHLDGFFYGIGYSASNSQPIDIDISGMSFSNSVSDDMYLDGGSNSNAETFKITNNVIGIRTRLRYLDNVYLYGNEISSANDIQRTSLTNFYTSVTGDNGDLGNKWIDFTCTDASNNFTTVYNNFSFVICNDNDYNVNGITDTNPVLDYNLYTPPGTIKTESTSRNC